MRSFLLAAIAVAAAGILPSCVITPEEIAAISAAGSRPTYSPPPQTHPYRAQSDYYSSGYYPYSTPAPTTSDGDKKAHAWDVGYRVAQDDFHHGRPNHMDQHQNLFDSTTHDAFRDGYKAGYAAARK